MSNEAINYVMQLPMDHSADKFLLVCLANYADEDGVSYPSQIRLQVNTCLDRKTVILGLKRLVELGHIEDTGIRKGSTQQVIVWRILGMPENGTIHYVYRVTNPKSGEFYIGKRSVACDPESDPYRGSGQWTAKVRREGVLLIKDVLGCYPTPQELVFREMEFIKAAQYDPLCMNLGTPHALRRAVGIDSTYCLSTDKSPKFPSKPSQISIGSIPNFPPKSPKSGTLNLKEPSEEQEVGHREAATPPPAPKKADPRGSRISEDWRPRQEEKDRAAELKVDWIGSGKAFLNHFLAKAGPDARKVNWDRAFQNWLERDAKYGDHPAPKTEPNFNDPKNYKWTGIGLL